MFQTARHLDKRLSKLRPLTKMARPPKGWIRAVRDALGMTTAQLARRMGVQQPRILELEQAEANGAVTLRSLQRAAEALGCRLVYVFVPDKPLVDVLRARVETAAGKQLAAVQQTMSLENQAVSDKHGNSATRQQILAELFKRPSRLWSES